MSWRVRAHTQTYTLIIIIIVIRINLKQNKQMEPGNQNYLMHVKIAKGTNNIFVVKNSYFLKRGH